MRYYTFLISYMISFVLLLGICKAENKSYSLEFKWKTKPELKVCESVKYDKKRNMLYVSCINGSPLNKAGKGFIAKLNLDGEIANLKWIDGLNAPKGMTIINDKLYVADVDELVEVDIVNSKILNKYKVEGAKFLNDVTNDEKGTVYFSDSQDNKIYSLSNGNIKLKYSSCAPNGVFFLNGILYVGDTEKGDILMYIPSLPADAPSGVFGNSGAGIDGLVPDGHGNWLCSDWSGRTVIVLKSGETIELLNTTDKKINSADIEYIENLKLLLIPTFFDNSVSAYILNN